MILKISDAAIVTVRNAIRDGSVVAFPTDTLFALSCDATNDSAIAKIFELKGRVETQTLPVLVASRDVAEQYVEFNKEAKDLADKYWPGAVTIVSHTKKNNKISKYCIGDEAIAIRVPANKTALDILSIWQKPLVGTSANLSGGPNAKSAKEVLEIFGDRVDVIIDDGTIFTDPIPSTIVSTIDGVRILRQGVVRV